jgi:hypothetical protein
VISSREHRYHCPYCGSAPWQITLITHDHIILHIEVLCGGCDCIYFVQPDRELGLRKRCPNCNGGLLPAGNSVIGRTEGTLGLVCKECKTWIRWIWESTPRRLVEPLNQN